MGWYTVHIAEVFYSYSVICFGLIYCTYSCGLYSYSVMCFGLIYCACSWGLYSYSLICVALIYFACSCGLYSYSVSCIWLIYFVCSYGLYNYSVICFAPTILVYFPAGKILQLTIWQLKLRRFYGNTPLLYQSHRP